MNSRGRRALDELTPAERGILDRHRFDAEAFAARADAMLDGTFAPHREPGLVQAPAPGDIGRVPPLGSWQGDALRDAGLQALHAGKAAVLLLNGGMATRFGGRVKGVVDALPGRSFLALQAQRLNRIGAETGRTPPLVLMSSFATDDETSTHLTERAHFGLPAGALFRFLQSAAPRLRTDGSLFRDAAGAISLYGPGHGDLLPSLRASRLLELLRQAGVEVVLMANVDNLGAALDPALLGHFLASGREMMVEVAPKSPGDVGGAPARVDGALRVLEGFAFPAEFDQATIPVLNTNTLWFSREALEREIALRWYVVHKQHEAEAVVQFEQLVGQASWTLATEYVQVAPERFLPVKEPADLEAMRPMLRRLFGVGLRAV